MTSSKATNIEAARQRVRDAQAAYREAEKKVAPARKALKISLREADAARSELRKVERALEDAREWERGRRIGAAIAKRDGVLACALADARQLLPQQVDRARALGLDDIEDLPRASKRTIAAIAELRRLLKPQKKRGGK